MKKITIIGAGISGLVAAICLARHGFDVEVREKRRVIGGSTKWHPSVHQQVFNLEKTSDYIGIDLSSCFRKVEKHTFYLYGRKKILDFPENSYVCEKGPRESSLEYFLFSVAVANGVGLEFDAPFDLREKEQTVSKKDKYIIATGLEIDLYRKLGIKHVVISGFRSSKISNRKSNRNKAISYFGDYTNQDFAYVASIDDLIFSLLFAREGVRKKHLKEYQEYLGVSDNIEFDDWLFSTGCVPVETNLVKNNFVLAGTISGMIDPFYLNGISAAIISGKIAALYFIDRQKAIYEFNRFTRNFNLKRILKLMSDKFYYKKITFPVFAFINNYVKWVGVV